jgi:hypothetical protein
MLGDLELSLVQRIDTDEGQVLVDHAVPGLAGNLTQHLNRDSTRITVRGAIDSDQAREGLERLREAFHAVEPLPFVADIMTATKVQQVLIADLEAQEVAGKPDRFEYRLVLDEYIPPPPDETAAVTVVNEEAQSTAQDDTRQITDQLDQGQAVLEVRVRVEGEAIDENRIRVLVQGTTQDGAPFDETIETPDADGIFRRRDVPVGTYRVAAYLADSTQGFDR